ncbi:ABC-2 type transport system permease protein [Antricoccus suffuscus]|uniref:Transport permease protein n=1 Tax=Antricoccus suffuscus TaxID=1629062 RepID=A0A2T1A6C6_9ACTN|nr:ABC transporter permease [Antricoccus suffuscus]PRZ44165.1 ABC-2 type transport system permease protein [Antricoccus suffuscus]
MSALTVMTKNEGRLFLREPAAVFWSLAFPIGLLIIFGLIPAFRDTDPDTGLRLINTYTPTLLLMAMTFLAVSGLPTTLTTYRERLILKRLATTPIGRSKMLAAQLLINLIFAAVMIVAVIVIARLAFDVPLADNIVGYLLSLILIAVVLLSLGLLVASIAKTAKVATAVGTILFFPLMFFAGLWIPIQAMPKTLATISEYTPLGAATRCLEAAASGGWPQIGHVGVLVAYIVVFGGIAVKTFRWE